MLDLLGRDLDRKPAHQAGYGPAGLLERRRPHNPSRTPVGHAEDDLAAALIGERRAIFGEGFEVKVVLGFLELQALPLRFGKPDFEFLDGGAHAGASPRSRSSARL
jgi:hypothetical protein